MMNNYLNQLATWHKASSTLDAYGAPSFTQHLIKVRWEYKRRLVRNKEGQEVVSECRVFCKASVEVGDKLMYMGKTYPVIACSILPTLNGTEHYREVSL